MIILLLLKIYSYIKMADIRIDLTLDYPVSIESILSLSFNQDSFKEVFQFILEALRRHETNFKALK